MNYRGFSILYSRADGWRVIVGNGFEFLATSEEDARQQVDEYIERKERMK